MVQHLPSDRYKNVSSALIFQFDMTRRNFYFINIYIFLSSYIRSSNSVRRSIYVHSIFDCVKMLSKRLRATGAAGEVASYRETDWQCRERNEKTEN